METVLLLEHHPANLIAQAMLLRSFGYAVLEAEDDREAARACLEHAGPIRLLVIGTTAAPGGDREITWRLQTLRPEMRVLLLASFAKSGTHVGADTLARFEIAQRFHQHILTLAGEPRRRAEAVVVLGVT